MSLTRSNYSLLTQAFGRHHQLKEVIAALQWDQMSMMNSSSLAASQRAHMISAVQDQMHAVLASPDVLRYVTHLYVDQEQLTIEERANFREMATYMKIRRSPIDHHQDRKLKMQKQMAAAETFAARKHCMSTGDWEQYWPLLEKAVTAAKVHASFTKDMSEDPSMNHGYDTLLEQHERELRTVFLDSYYTGLKEWLPPLIDSVRSKTERDVVIFPEPHFQNGEPVKPETYLSFAKDVLDLFQFDWTRGRVDASTVNVTSNSTNQTRILFASDPRNILRTVNHIFHEAGHAKYEQGLPSGIWAGQPGSWARSTAWHESQSQFVEMFILRHPKFTPVLCELLQKHFGGCANPAWTVHNLQLHFRRPQAVIPKKNEPPVPVDLSMQIECMIWYELERDLFLDRLQVKDLPAAVADKILRYLGVDVTSVTGGPQNIIIGQSHWSQGNFGYVPVYTSGMLYAAQLWASMTNDLGGLDKMNSLLEQGKLEQMWSWLDVAIWKHGSILVTDDLLVGASGTRLNTRFYQDFLRERYS